MIDTTAYWLERGKIYRESHRRLNPISKFRFHLQERAIIKELYRYAPFESILEVGCGYGRITARILENISLSAKLKRYVATDISKDQLQWTQKLAKDNNIELRQISIEDLDYQAEFDLVLASEVLMHIPPDKIGAAIKKLMTATKGYVLNVDWCAPSEPKEAGGFCYQHDYEALYNDHLVKTVPLWPSRLMRQNIWIAYK